MASGVGLAGCGHGILCALVLAAAIVTGISCGYAGSGEVALDDGGAFDSGVRGGTAVHLGFRLDGAGNAGSDGAAEEACGGGLLSMDLAEVPTLNGSWP